MKCKFCEAELEEDVSTCPACGAEQNTAEETAEQTPVVAAEEVVEEAAPVAEETPETEATEPAEETSDEEAVAPAVEQPKQKKKISWQTIVAIITSVIALICLGLLLASVVFGVNLANLFKNNEEPEPTEEPLAVGDFVSEVDYTADEKAAKDAATEVVATMNGMELTNSQLQIYYSMLVDEFMTNYYQYLEQLGLDMTKDLNTQASYYDETMSWEAYFVNAAISTWKNYMAVSMMADEEGFALSEGMQEALEKMPEELLKVAEEAGYKTVDELVSNRMGGGSTLEDYLAYSRAYYLGAEYTSILPTDEELSTYFDSLAEAFAEYGVTKESGPIVSVRHILLQPEGGTTADDGTTTYSEAEWAACLESAEAVLEEWKVGGATEALFAELANKYSTDPGSNTNGGLYTEITSETTFVEPFLNWCMDASRQIGDTDIVKTDYGYHVMYFSTTEELWLYHAKSQYVSDRTTEIMETGVEKWPIEIFEDKICLEPVDLT